MRREAIFSTEAPTSHITHERTIWFRLSITTYGSSRWYGAELPLLKTRKRELFTWRVPKSNTWQCADKYSSRKKEISKKSDLWTVASKKNKEKNQRKAISAMWYRLYSFSLGSRAKIWGWRMEQWATVARNQSYTEEGHVFVCSPAKANAHFTEEWGELDKTGASDTNTSYQIRSDPTKSSWDIWLQTINVSINGKSGILKALWFKFEPFSWKNPSKSTGGIFSRTRAAAPQAGAAIFPVRLKTEGSCNESHVDCDLYNSDSWENHLHHKPNKAHIIAQRLLF